MVLLKFLDSDFLESVGIKFETNHCCYQIDDIIVSQLVIKLSN